MVSFARLPEHASYGSIWRRPTRLDRIKAALFGWYEVRGGSYDPRTGKHTMDSEYFPPAWLVWLRQKYATVF